MRKYYKDPILVFHFRISIHIMRRRMKIIIIFLGFPSFPPQFSHDNWGNDMNHVDPCDETHKSLLWFGVAGEE